MGFYFVLIISIAAIVLFVQMNNARKSSNALNKARLAEKQERLMQLIEKDKLLKIASKLSD